MHLTYHQALSILILATTFKKILSNALDWLPRDFRMGEIVNPVTSILLYEFVPIGTIRYLITLPIEIFAWITYIA